MVEILDHLHQYVPQIEYQVEHFIPETNESVCVAKAKTHHTMLGGDQLSQARARSALLIKRNSDSPSAHLDGFVPTVEDWHAKLCLFEVC